jgi:quercetin dioxygenase-like cupin family protein
MDGSQKIPERAYSKTEGLLGHLYIRTMIFDREGDFIEQHEHRFDHVTIVIRGPLMMKVDGVETVANEGERLLVRRGRKHGFTAKADDCLAYCIYSEEHARKMGEIL